MPQSTSIRPPAHELPGLASGKARREGLLPGTPTPEPLQARRWQEARMMPNASAQPRANITIASEASYHSSPDGCSALLGRRQKQLSCKPTAVEVLHDMSTREKISAEQTSDFRGRCKLASDAILPSAGLSDLTTRIMHDRLPIVRNATGLWKSHAEWRTEVEHEINTAARSALDRLCFR